ncbi:hypothetical protein HYDPIDRAFT_34968, partial [Hydnomerulius pinastri MD-312]
MFDLASLPAQAPLALVFQVLARGAAAAGRKVIRAVDLANTSDVGASLDVILGQLLQESGVLVEYFCAASTPEDADAKTSLLKYAHARSLTLESWNLGDDSENTL